MADPNSTTMPMQPIGPEGLRQGTREVKDNMAAAEKSGNNLSRMLGRVSGVFGGGRTGFAQPQAIPASANGGGARIPGSAVPAADEMMSRSTYRWQMAGDAWSATKNAAAAGVSLLPNAAQGIDKQQIRFHTGVYAGSYQLGLAYEQSALQGIGDRRTSINAAQRVAYQTAASGISGANAGGVAQLSGWGALQLGMTNEQAAGAHLSTVHNVQFQNYGLFTGMQTTDAQGNRLTGEALYENIWRRLGLGTMSSEDLRAAMQSGRGVGLQLDEMGMSAEDQEMFKAWAMNKSGDKSYSMALDKGARAAEANDRNKNPLAGVLDLISREDDYVATGTEAAVKGFGAMNSALEKAVGGLDRLYQATKSVADVFQWMNGAGVAWGSSQTGGQLSSAYQYGKSALGDVLSMYGTYKAFKGGKRLVERIGRGGSPGGGPGGPGRLLKIAGRAGLAAGTYWGLGKAENWLQDKGKNLPGWMRSGGQAAFDFLQGGITGFTAGGPWGAVAGAVAGGGKSLADWTSGSGEYDYADTADTGYNSQRHAEGVWNISRAHLAKLHEGEAVLPADVAESFRSAVQKHLGAVPQAQSGGGGYVKVDVTLNNASWGEAQRLIRVVQEAVDTSQTLEALASR